MKAQISVVVTSRVHDRVLWRPAQALNAVLIPKPMTEGGLLAAVYRAAIPEARDSGPLWPSRVTCRNDLGPLGIPDSQTAARNRGRDIRHFPAAEAWWRSTLA